MTAMPTLIKPVRFTGLDQAPLIPTGARVVGAYWALAENYGPGAAEVSEAAAIRAGIERYEQRKREHDAYSAGLGMASLPEAFWVDLRWKMEWDQGATTDAHGRRTSSSGIEFTVRRTHYESIAEAQAHLARIERVRVPEPEPMPVGKMLDIILKALGADARITVTTAAHETVFDLFTTGQALRAKNALADYFGDPFVVVMRSNLVHVHRRPHV